MRHSQNPIIISLLNAIILFNLYFYFLIETSLWVTVSIESLAQSDFIVSFIYAKSVFDSSLRKVLGVLTCPVTVLSAFSLHPFRLKNAVGSPSSLSLSNSVFWMFPGVYWPKVF